MAEEEEKNASTYWYCCGKKTDKQFVKYIVQVSFGVALVSFSVAQIIRNVPNKEVYFSLIGSTVGYFLPAPGYEHIQSTPIPKLKLSAGNADPENAV